MGDLSLETTDCLLEELNGRFDHLVFAGLRVLKIEDTKDDSPSGLLVCRYRGNMATCAGLASRINYVVMADYDREAASALGDEPGC